MKKKKGLKISKIKIAPSNDLEMAFTQLWLNNTFLGPNVTTSSIVFTLSCLKPERTLKSLYRRQNLSLTYHSHQSGPKGLVIKLFHFQTILKALF